MRKVLPLFISLLVFAAALGGYLYAVNAVQTLIRRASSAAEEADALTKKDSALQSVGAALRDTESLSNALATFVSSPTDVVRGIELLEDAGRKSGARLKLGAVNVTEPQAWVYHEVVTLAFSAEGTFPQLVKLFGLIEALPHVVRIEHATFTKPEGESWKANASVVFLKEKS